MDSLHLVITLTCFFLQTHGSLCFQFSISSEIPHLRELVQCSVKGRMSPFLRETLHHAFFYYYFTALGISATSEDIPNKIEDLRSECSSDFGGKDSVTSPDGEESVHGSKVAASPARPSVQCYSL